MRRRWLRMVIAPLAALQRQRRWRQHNAACSEATDHTFNFDFRLAFTETLELSTRTKVLIALHRLRKNHDVHGDEDDRTRLVSVLVDQREALVYQR